jgi:hypothetical protein
MPFKHSVHANTLKDYFKLPLEQRERSVWWWPFNGWYNTPFAMFCTFDKAAKTEPSEWDKFHDYVKEYYPVQYWLRETLYDFFFYTIRYKLKDFKRKVKYRIINPRKKMRKAVFPSTYWDLETHIVQFHIECIIEYVEREKCFENISWDWNDEVKARGAELKEAYEYCKTGRAKLQAELDEAWERVPSAGTYEVVYKEVNDKEAWLKECDTKLCTWVINNREVLWT